MYAPLVIDYPILKYKVDSGAHMQTTRAIYDAAKCEMSEWLAVTQNSEHLLE